MTNFKTGYLIHEKFMDIAFEVIKVQYIGSNYVKLKVFTWNRGWTDNPFLSAGIKQPSTVKIKAENYSQWKYINTLKRILD